jgi:hypothetical protein
MRANPPSLSRGGAGGGGLPEAGRAPSGESDAGPESPPPLAPPLEGEGDSTGETQTFFRRHVATGQFGDQTERMRGIVFLPGF